ncbi:hypothetical protein [Pseudonocardia sp.]|uniref:hypothetical protein n=1 Tax=Pseudonocardia sp. TaxID=60912 RepID=UPI003D13816A
MTAEPATVRARLTSVGIPADRLAVYVERGLLLLDGEPVTDLDAPTEPGSRIVIAGS